MDEASPMQTLEATDRHIPNKRLEVICSIHRINNDIRLHEIFEVTEKLVSLYKTTIQNLRMQTNGLSLSHRIQLVGP